MDTEKMEKKIIEALGNGNIQPHRLYDCGLQLVFVEQAGGEVKFTWFDYSYDIEDYVDC